MRLFIAVDVDEKVKAGAAGLIAALTECGAGVKWTEPANLHLTLAFLGDTPPGRLAALEGVLASTAAGSGPFEISFDRIGAFGAPLRPRVLWLGVGAGAKVLSELAGSLRASLAENGFFVDEPDREFAAHLTLGRVRGPRAGAALSRALEACRLPSGLNCRAERIVLYRSRLSSSGPAYEALNVRALGTES